MIRPSDSAEDEGPPKKKLSMPTTNSFSVIPITKYAQGFPFFRQPIEFGQFSLDGTRKFHNDSSQLKYYVPPDVDYGLNLNLRDGYETCVEKDDDVKERLTHLLTWIRRNTNKFQLNNQDGSKIQNKKYVLHGDPYKIIMSI